MSAPAEEESERRRFLEAPKWMDGEMSLLAAPAFAMFGVACAVGLLVLAVFVATGRISAWWLLGALGLAGVAFICARLYRGTIGRTSVTLVPKNAPPDRVFPVMLWSRGGWLRQYLEPTVGACIVIEDDGVCLSFRRPMNQFVLAGFVFQFAGLGEHIGLRIPDSVLLIGSMACFGLFIWSGTRRHELRFAWTRVHSVTAAEDRFHLRLDDEDYPDGFLFGVNYKIRDRMAALFAERTLFHDEGA